MTWESLKDVVQRLEDGTPPPPWAGLFGGSPRPEDCDLVLIPVPWDATTSYKPGTHKGPDAIVSASHQLDLEDGRFDRPYRAGITMLPTSPSILELNRAARARAERVIEAFGHESVPEADLAFVNDASAKVNAFVYDAAKEHLKQERLVGVVGGDHASPYGLIKALAESSTQPFTVLHFDAHLDLRDAYEGFQHSHASIMHNVMRTLPSVQRLVQVGIRDYSRDEVRYAQSLKDRSKIFYSRDLFNMAAAGDTWQSVTQRILAACTDRVYVSFDIDGLDPAYCPSTGTPVPGGLSFEAACYLLEALATGGKRIIGFDLCEVAPGETEWDANVGARVLYKLCGATLHSQNRLTT